MTDLIKREDAIEAIRESRSWHFHEIIPVLSAVKDIPSVEPKRGKRIYKRTDITLSCYPPKQQYFCGDCDWVGSA